jgi:hypothetical protein
MRGDLRPAYLAWLLAVAAEDIDDDAEEPPVPAGLAEMTGAQEAMVEFLRIASRITSSRASCSTTSGSSVPIALPATSTSYSRAFGRSFVCVASPPPGMRPGSAVAHALCRASSMHVFATGLAY